MPIKRINFTNRKRLTRDQANIVIHPALDIGVPATFDAHLDLNCLRPGADAARVFVEAYHQTTRMRFDFGTVAAVRHPLPVECRLNEFSDWKDVRFRVKVTDVTLSPGRIVAWAGKIKPKGPDDQDQPDLVRFKDSDLDGLLWDIEFDEEGPVVLIDRSAGGAHKIGRNDRFIGAVYPEILRRLLEKALLEERVAYDDPDHWFKIWHDGYLTKKLGLRSPPADDPDSNQMPRRGWINDAVSTFARRFRIVDNWKADDEKQLGGRTDAAASL